MNIELLKEKMNTVKGLRDLLEELSKRERARKTINYKRIKRVFLDNNRSLDRSMFDTICQTLQDCKLGVFKQDKRDSVFLWDCDMGAISRKAIGTTPIPITSPSMPRRLQLPKIKISTNIVDKTSSHDIVKITKNNVEIQVNLTTMTNESCGVISRLLSQIEDV